MNKLAKVNQLLDEYLYGSMSAEKMQQAYRETLQPAYNKLTYRNDNKVFHESENFRGTVSPYGEVAFQRNIPGYGYSYRSPEELMSGAYDYDSDYTSRELAAIEAAANRPQPARELIQMNKNFKDYSNSPDGSRLYSNTPISEHRAKAYEKVGFQYPDVGMKRTQYMDTRPYADNDLFNKLYAVGDVNTHGVEMAQLALEQRAARNNLGSRVANIQSALPSIYDKQNAPRQIIYQEAEQPLIMPTVAPQQGSIEDHIDNLIRNPRGRLSADLWGNEDGTYDLTLGDEHSFRLESNQIDRVHDALMRDNRWSYQRQDNDGGEEF